jgi:catechol 2,3-dioxygenase-like lactoylglutathione lyase family enzyme
MNQPPRNPSSQTPQHPFRYAATVPTPDPQTVLDYVQNVLGIRLAEWQAGALYDTFMAYGYAVLASADVDDVEDQPAEQPRALPFAQPSEASKGGQEGPRPYAPTRIPPSQTPIGDSLPTGPRDA